MWTSLSYNGGQHLLAQLKGESNPLLINQSIKNTSKIDLLGSKLRRVGSHRSAPARRNFSEDVVSGAQLGAKKSVWLNSRRRYSLLSGMLENETVYAGNEARLDGQ